MSVWGGGVQLLVQVVPPPPPQPARMVADKSAIPSPMMCRELIDRIDLCIMTFSFPLQLRWINFLNWVNKSSLL
jgi:hypothetical protein